MAYEQNEQRLTIPSPGTEQQEPNMGGGSAVECCARGLRSSVPPSPLCVRQFRRRAGPVRAVPADRTRPWGWRSA